MEQIGLTDTLHRLHNVKLRPDTEVRPRRIGHIASIDRGLYAN